MIALFRSIYYFINRFFSFSLTLSFLLCMFYVSACHSSTPSSKKLGLHDTLIVLPPPQQLSAADSTAYNHASEIWYDTILKRSGFNGGMMVAKNGHIIFEKYAGTAHLNGTDSITAKTPMHIASISKTFTAMSILKLWQDKKLDLDDEYSKYFPSFNYPGVTIRTLLDHRSGLPNYLYFMERLGWNKKTFVKNQDVYDYLVNKKASLLNISKPNTRFTYCNTNYALLALLAEKISGMAFPEFIKQTFFDPLQMTNSYIFVHSDSATATPSYDWRGRIIPLDYLDDVYGDKNVYTTPEDLLTWDKALKSNTIFTAATLEQAYTGYSNEKAGIKNYGLGWRMNNYPNGKKIIYHNGWWHGSNAAFVRLIEDDATIIIIGNKYNRNIYKAKDLSNIFSKYFDTDIEEDLEQNKTTPEIVIPKQRKKAFIPHKIIRKHK